MRVPRRVALIRVAHLRVAHLLIGLALVALGSSCSVFSGGRHDYTPSAGPYDRLPAEDLARVLRARELIESDELLRARAVLAEVHRRRPQNLPVGALLQDVETLLARSGVEGVPGLGELPREALERARAEPSPARLLLAARIAPNADLARGLMGEAIELDPDCAWAHYALAWSLARENRWREAQERLQLALDIDPGHLSARRLEAGLLARAGDPEAVDAFERWLRVTEGDPLVEPEARLAALLDLAQLHLLAGRERRAREALLALVDEPTSGARRECLLAATEHSAGRRNRALAASRRGAEADPSDPLPMVQQALLLENSFGDVEGARAAWQQVLELSSRDSDLAAVILGMRARVALERFDARALRAEREAAAAQP